MPGRVFMRRRLVQHAVNVLFLIEFQMEGDGQSRNAHRQIGDGGFSAQSLVGKLVKGEFGGGLHDKSRFAGSRYTARTASVHSMQRLKVILMKVTLSLCLDLM